MRFTPTELPGVVLVESDAREDARGSFFRTWCREEFARAGLVAEVSQSSVSFNHRRGTIRGLHFQDEPSAETKLVRCVRGSMYDVVVDVRNGSPTRGRWLAVTLSADVPIAVYVPAGFAHGFQTLADATSVHYQMDVAYDPGAQRGYRWNDPAFGIPWPIPDPIVSERDRNLPPFGALG